MILRKRSMVSFFLGGGEGGGGVVLSFYRVLAHCGVYTYRFTMLRKIPRLDAYILLLDGILRAQML